MQSAEQTQTNLMSLPKDIHALIFSQLLLTDLARLRPVHSALKKTIDTNFEKKPMPCELFLDITNSPDMYKDKNYKSGFQNPDFWSQCCFFKGSRENTHYFLTRKSALNKSMANESYVVSGVFLLKSFASIADVKNRYTLCKPKPHTTDIIAYIDKETSQCISNEFLENTSSNSKKMTA